MSTIGNTELIEHGIFQENSDIRCHVAPITRRVYVFQTQKCITLLRKKPFREVYGYQHDFTFPTAKGYLVPWDQIPDVRVITWRDIEWWKYFSEDASTSKKGKTAAELITILAQLGLLPIWATVTDVNNIQEDIDGTDMLICGPFHIQVKCDFKAGPKEFGGSGNLYIQTHECNPGKYH